MRAQILRTGFKHHWLDWINRQEVFVFILLLIAILFLSLTTTTFLTTNNLQNVSNLAWIAIPAFGESLVILIGGIDLSVGAVMALSGLVTALALQWGLPIPLAILAGLAGGSLIGWVTGTLVGRVKFPPFIVTLGMAAIVRGIIFGLAGGWPILNLPSGFRFLGQADIRLGPVLFPVPVLIMLLLAILVYTLLRATVLGRYIYTLGDSEQALIVTGVGLPQIKTIVYMLCSALTAVGGILMTARLGVAAPTAATGYELDIIAAVIIGGTSLLGGQGTILGVFLGAAFMQVLRNGLVLLGIPAYWQTAALGSVIIIALLLDLATEQDQLMRIGRLLKFIMLLFLVACQSAPGQPARKTDTVGLVRRKITIAWIPKGLNNPVFEVGRLGAIQKAAELTAAGPIDVEVLYAGPVNSDGAEQARVVDDVVARGVNAIAISCDDPTACIDPINRAVSAGIPVMTWDADSPQSQRFTYLGLDNIQAGRAGADLLVQAMGTEGKVAILTGVPGAENLETRITGFREGLAEYPEIHIIATVVTNDDINLGVQAVEDTMQAHPDIKGWYFAGMWPLFADRGSMPLWEEAALHRGMKTIAFDALPVELNLLRDGYLSGLLDQKNWSWGYETIQIVYDHIVNNKDFPSFVNLGYNVITKNNVDAMLQAWETNDFTKPLPPP